MESITARIARKLRYRVTVPVIKLIPSFVKPNYLSCARLLLAPVLLWLVLNEEWTVAIILLTAAAVTDILDGELARQRSQTTKRGAALDPFIDKIITYTVLLPLWRTAPFLIAALLLTDLIVLAGAAIYLLVKNHKGRKLQVKATWAGKIKFVTQVLAVLFLLFWQLLPVTALLSLFYASLIVSLIMAFLSIYFHLYKIFLKVS